MRHTEKPAVIPRKYLFSFILVTTLFSLWGFANDVTNPLVAVFKDVFVINNAQSTWVQMAFYGGYATMALPAAIFIRRFSYKSGIIVGLALYSIGALLSIPAAREFQLVHYCALYFDLWPRFPRNHRESIHPIDGSC